MEDAFETLSPQPQGNNSALLYIIVVLIACLAAFGLYRTFSVDDKIENVDTKTKDNVVSTFRTITLKKGDSPHEGTTVGYYNRWTRDTDAEELPFRVPLTDYGTNRHHTAWLAVVDISSLRADPTVTHIKLSSGYTISTAYNITVREQGNLFRLANDDGATASTRVDLQIAKTMIPAESGGDGASHAQNFPPRMFPVAKFKHNYVRLDAVLWCFVKSQTNPEDPDTFSTEFQAEVADAEDNSTLVTVDGWIVAEGLRL